LKAGLNFTLETDAGDVDLLGEVAGVGTYVSVAKGCVTFDVFGHPVQVMGLDLLEKAKKAAGRIKDILDLGEIQAIRSRSK
jgi:hypothetical protein